jgi:hypothetical protein
LRALLTTFGSAQNARASVTHAASRNARPNTLYDNDPSVLSTLRTDITGITTGTVTLGIMGTDTITTTTIDLIEVSGPATW